MLSDEKPRITLKFEVNLPNNDGGPPHKFCVNRMLKARWCQDPQVVTLEILNEIKNYKGSFVGDMISSLAAIVSNENAIVGPEHQRTVDVSCWTSSLLEKLLFHAIKEKLYEEYLDNEIEEWDGSCREIKSVEPDEIADVDVDKLLILMAPKLKHMLMIMSKNLKKRA
jgi:hypothetical protein